MESPLELTKEEDQELLPAEILRSEVNFLVYPFFALTDKDVRKRDKIEYKFIVQRNTEKLEVFWGVYGHQRYGFPGPFEKKLHRAIEEIIGEHSFPIGNPIHLGSLAGIARKMGLKPLPNGKYPGRVYRKIKEGLLRISTAEVESKGTFYHKQKKAWLEKYFHLYDMVVFKGEPMPGGDVADDNHLFLGKWFLENVNARYVRPIDNAYYKSLTYDISKRYYEILGVKFYYLIQANLPSVCYKYSTLCQLLPVTRHKHYSLAMQKLDRAHEELKATQFLEKVEWPKEPISKGERDWYLSFFPGPRAMEEVKKYQACYQVAEGETLATLKQLPPAFPSNQQELIERLEALGVTLQVAQELVRNSKEEDIKDWIAAINTLTNIHDKPAYLVKAIKGNWALPESLRKAQKAKKRKEQIQNCKLCDDNGFIHLEEENGHTFSKHCSHSQKKELQFIKDHNLQILSYE